MWRRSWALLIIAAVLLAACGGQSGSSGTTTPASGGASSGQVGNASNGQALFNQATLGKDNLPGCKTCHSVVGEEKIVGPSLAGIGTDAQTAFTESGYKGTAKSAADYLREAIVNPNVDVPEGYAPNVMPQNFKDELTPDQINDLVAYLLTLKADVQ